jgi:Ca2+/H+ antiporter
MSDMINSYLEDAETVLLSIVLLVGIVFVIATWMRTKSVMPTIGALVLAIVVYWGVDNYDSVSKSVGSDIEDRQNDSSGSGRIRGL